MGSDGAGLPFPPRPAITAPFAAAMAFWAGCAAAYSSMGAVDAGSCMRASVAAFALLAASAPFSLWRRTRLAGVLAAALSVGVALGGVQAAAVHSAASRFYDAEGVRAELALLEDSRDAGFGESALVEARLGDAQPAVFTARFGAGEPLLAGERLSASVSFKAADYAQDPYAWTKGSCGFLKASGCEKLSVAAPQGELIAFRSRAIEGIGGDDARGALLQALVCGYRRNVSGTEMYSDFQTCGLAHLVAVSGAHLVIVTGLAAAALKRMRAPRKLAVFVLVAVMGCYYVVAGMPVSALRALAMSALGLFAFFGKRRASSLNAVGIATFAMVGTSPCTAVSPSFALSALSTTGIVLFAPLAQAWIERTPIGSFKLVSDALALTFSASLLSQLYACSLFSQLPLIAPLANVVSAPLFPFVCGTGLVAAVAGSGGAGALGAIGFVAGVLSTVLAELVGVLASVPYASVPFAIDSRVALAVSAAAASVLWAAWPQPSLRVAGGCAASALAVAIAFAITSGAGDDAIVALDVGQGDAILVQSRGMRMLVDTGNEDSKLLEQLASNHVAHLDAVLISHSDDDHMGSIDALEKAVAVDRFILAEGMLDCPDAKARSLVDQAGECAPEVVGVGVGETISFGAFNARVVWPDSFTEDGGNADSLCVVLDYDGDDDGETDFTALLTGDAEKEELASMLDEGRVGDIDILKVGHHGSRNGSTPEQMAALDPEVALISCGAGNRYGHPTQDILDQLESVGARVYRTDLDGSVRCVLTCERITVSCSG